MKINDPSLGMRHSPLMYCTIRVKVRSARLTKKAIEVVCKNENANSIIENFSYDIVNKSYHTYNVTLIHISVINFTFILIQNQIPI